MNFNRTSSLSLGLLILRLALGAVFIMHGWQKLNDVTVSGTVAMFAQAGIPAADIVAPFTVYSELIGGVLLVFGALTRLAALLIALNMVGAILFVHTVSHGFFLDNNGYEYVLMLGAAALALVFTGPGAFALDRVFVRRG